MCTTVTIAPRLGLVVFPVSFAFAAATDAAGAADGPPPSLTPSSASPEPGQRRTVMVPIAAASARLAVCNYGQGAADEAAAGRARKEVEVTFTVRVRDSDATTDDVRSGWRGDTSVPVEPLLTPVRAASAPSPMTVGLGGRHESDRCGRQHAGAAKLGGGGRGRVFRGGAAARGRGGAAADGSSRLDIHRVARHGARDAAARQPLSAVQVCARACGGRGASRWRAAVMLVRSLRCAAADPRCADVAALPSLQIEWEGTAERFLVLPAELRAITLRDATWVR